MTSVKPATPRTAGRMFVLDDQSRVLLMHERRDLDSEDSHWITPGGGVEPGESLAEAAMREVYEETGLRIPLAAGAEPMYVERVPFHFAGDHFDQTNHYFLVRVPTGLDIAPAAHTEAEKIVVLGHRWWSLAELEASTVVREPVTMVELIRAAIGGEPADGDDHGQGNH
jgi:8-oxo-dGTP pyrophosphatase MutT (NUDIX family)